MPMYRRIDMGQADFAKVGSTECQRCSCGHIDAQTASPCCYAAVHL